MPFRIVVLQYSQGGRRRLFICRILQELTKTTMEHPEIVRATSRPVADKFKRRFLIRISERLIPVEAHEIAYFFVDNNITFIKTWEDKRYIVEFSLTDLQQLLDPEQFFRINRSHLVSFRSLSGITLHYSNRLRLSLTPPFREEVFVSRDKVPDFKKWIGG
ncbi:MAG: LytTR family transcriptional regulator [Chitinophagaceae bacterium]|nr:MAG: LytTR family transcriptional regulator [Chitinophagaceae bacterium]